MPRFETPEAVTATLEMAVASVRVTASSRSDTLVEVLPTDGAQEADVHAAQQTKVSCVDGDLQIKGPKTRSLFRKGGSVDITVELPAGSQIRGTAALGEFACAGPLGDCDLKLSVGDIRVDQAQAATLKSEHGDIRLVRAARADIKGAGRIDIGTVTGSAITSNSNGETVIDEVTGELRVKSSNGRVSIGVARAGVDAKSANGAIRIGEVTRGQVTLDTAIGDVEVGIRVSTAAWLDVSTRLGTVRNSLSSADAPEDSDDSVAVHARTGLGDIVIQRA
jgi:DUF4097 and DUF4098 domain-containing protein YvlB